MYQSGIDQFLGGNGLGDETSQGKHMLNKIENLVVNPCDRFCCFESPDGLFDKVNSA